MLQEVINELENYLTEVFVGYPQSEDTDKKIIEIVLRLFPTTLCHVLNELYFIPQYTIENSVIKSVTLRPCCHKIVEIEEVGRGCY